MHHDKIEQLLQRIETLNDTMDPKLARSLELNLLKRIIRRLQSFDCTVCEDYLPALTAHIAYFEHHEQPEKQAIKEYRKTTAAIKAHLQTEHKLVSEGYFMSIYMSVGMSIGVALGLAVFDNIALGLPIGMSVGLAIGAGLDADMKKKGKTI